MKAHVPTLLIRGNGATSSTRERELICIFDFFTVLKLIDLKLAIYHPKSINPQWKI